MPVMPRARSDTVDAVPMDSYSNHHDRQLPHDARLRDHSVPTKGAMGDHVRMLDSDSQGFFQPPLSGDPHTLTAWNYACRRMNELWLLELLSCLFSLGLLAAILGVLAHHNGQQKPAWSLGFSLNSVISILATALKISMIYAISQGISQLKWSWFLRQAPLYDLALFDSASRGPLGALVFLFQRRLSLLAKLGAFVTLVALAVDPFAQAVVTYNTCSHQISGTATIKRTENVPSVETVGSTQALLSNLINLNADIYPPERPICPTGNCTFTGEQGFYQTLAMTHNCQDITDTIIATPINGSDPNTFNKFNLSVVDGSVFSPINLTAAYTGANYPGNAARLKDGGGTNSVIFDLAFLFLNSTLTPWPANMSVVEHFTGGHVYHPISRPLDFKEPRLGVRCQFQAAMRTLNSNVTSGKLSSTKARPDDVGDTSELRTNFRAPDGMTMNDAIAAKKASPDPPTFLNTPPQVLRDGVLIDCKNSTAPTQEHTMPLARSINPDNGSVDWSTVAFYRPECVFIMNANAKAEFSTALDQVFGDEEEFRSIRASAGSEDTPGWDLQNDLTSLHLSSLWNLGAVSFADVDNYAGRIADTMTAVMAHQSAGNATANTPTAGFVNSTTTCVYVRWGWITLPVVLTLLAHVFLIAAIIKSVRDARRPGWPGLLKSSPLALLFLKPKVDSTSSYDGPIDPTHMMKETERVRTTLERR